MAGYAVAILYMTVSHPHNQVMIVHACYVMRDYVTTRECDYPYAICDLTNHPRQVMKLIRTYYGGLYHRVRMTSVSCVP
jgi:hypothetical protein